MFIVYLVSLMLSRENLDRSQSLKTALIWLNDIGWKKYECSLEIHPNYKLSKSATVEANYNFCEIQVTAAIE